jgi:hypothetical protein
MTLRVRRWKRHLHDSGWHLPSKEYELGPVLTDPARDRSLDIIFQRYYEHIAGGLAARAGRSVIPVSQIQLEYAYHLRSVHARSTVWPGEVSIVISLGLVQLLYGWIRGLASVTTDRERPVPIERPEVVASRMANLLDLASAPMLWTQHTWRPNDYQVAVAEELTRFCERFVMGHEIAHIYVADEESIPQSGMIPNWSSLGRRQRRRELELLADGLAVELNLQAAHGAKVAVAGATLSLSAIDLIERYDEAFQVRGYPRGAERRAHLEAWINERVPELVPYASQWEYHAKSYEARTLPLALQRRKVAADAMEDLLSGGSGSLKWTQQEFNDAAQAVLHHSRSATLEAFITAYESPTALNDVMWSRLRDFIDGYLREPLYAPFFQRLSLMGIEAL